MAAVSWNQHIQVMNLNNSNLQKTQGFELADALRGNQALGLRALSIESNCLDSSAVREIAEAIRENKDCQIEQLAVAHQKQVGTHFGRPTEEALGRMMQSNETIVKLGLECHDAHWRNVIDRALLRNNDIMRRRERQIDEDVSPVEERPLGQLALVGSPPPLPNCLATRATGISPASASTSAGPSSASASAGASEDEDNAMEGRRPCSRRQGTPKGLLLDYVLRNLKVPNTTQLQNYAKNGGAVGSMPGAAPTAMPYSIVAPMIKDFVTTMLDAAKQSEVMATDAFGTEQPGVLSAWNESNGSWSFEVAAEASKKYVFRSKKEPSFHVSAAWAEFMLRKD